MKGRGDGPGRDPALGEATEGEAVEPISSALLPGWFEDRVRVLERAFDASIDGIALADLDGHVAYANAAWRTMHGFDAADERCLIGLHLRRFHSEQQFEGKLVPLLRKLVETGSFRGEVDRLRQDGQEFPSFTSATVLRDDSGHPLGFVLNARDISARKLAERQLIESQRRLRLLNAIAAGVSIGMSEEEVIRHVVDRMRAYFSEHRVLFCRLDERGVVINEYARAPDAMSACDMAGFSFELAPDFLEDLRRGQAVIAPDVDEDPRTRPMAGLLRARSTRAVLAMPIRHSNRLLGTLCLHASEPGSWSRYEADTLREVGDALAVALNEALTYGEHQRARRALAEKARELGRSNAELEQFAYVASHDLQEPLRIVASYTALLQARYKGQLDDEADRFIGYAVEGAERMHHLIRDLLALARAGGRGTDLRPTPLGPVVEEVLGNLRVAIDEVGGEVLYGDLPAVLGDHGQLVQLLQNLVGNALKFHGDRPPQVRITTEREPEGRWRLSVFDDGIGLHEEHAERIFLAFQRLHGRDRYGGTGIGLAIAKKIVERHGGRIWVESRPGEGTAFHLTLRPVEEDPGG